MTDSMTAVRSVTHSTIMIHTRRTDGRLDRSLPQSSRPSPFLSFCVPRPHPTMRHRCFLSGGGSFPHPRRPPPPTPASCSSPPRHSMWKRWPHRGNAWAVAVNRRGSPRRHHQRWPGSEAATTDLCSQPPAVGIDRRNLPLPYVPRPLAATDQRWLWL